ncbi:MAG: hypothetical protein J6M10_09340 [Clostridia bacterium]|nr:hypothetical protein [Clostridia bacterium]
MVKRIIPGNMSPWECEINDVKYVYPPGTEQMVPDEVAHVIDAWYASQEPKYPEPETGGGSVTPEQVEDAVEATVLEKGIIKRSLLPEGYPYTGFVEIFPEQTISFPEETDYQAPFMQPIGLVGGENYEVRWRGTVYPCEAVSVDMDGYPAVVMGDLGIMTGEPTGSHPFIIVEFSPDLAAANGGLCGGIIAIDGHESAAVSIRGIGDIPIDKKFLPEGYPYILEGGITVLEEQALTPSASGYECPVKLTPHAGYVVTWNATEYSVVGGSVTDTDGTAYYWGNPLALGLDAADYPFLIFCNNNGEWGILATDEAADASAEVTMKIVTQKTFMPMDKRYMPDGGKLNIVNGEASDSLRGTSSAKERDGYKLGYESLALGYQAKASGNVSLAFGDRALASGLHSVAIGEKAQATEWGAFAMGSEAVSSGRSSFSVGYCTKATGAYSRAVGNTTTASGGGAHAQGYMTVASGDSSHAEGNHTIASYDYQHVQGKYNVEGNYAHIVGNGHYYTESKEMVRSNAHTLDWDGNAWFAGSVEGTALILKSPGGKRYKVTVSDSGSLTAAEITQ